MKTLVCGLGKCGSRMVHDLNTMIYDGVYSCNLRVPKDTLLKLKVPDLFTKIKNLFKNPLRLDAKDLDEEEIPPMFFGDSDGQNEVVNLCLAQSDDEKDEERRKRLLNGLIEFENYHDACGQYHIIGEEVMRNLFASDPTIKPRLVDAYINENNKDNVSAYFIMFSAGGGTGCGTSTVLAEKIAQRANEEFHNMLIAGITALPGDGDSARGINYRISAGRFLTKFLSAPRSTSFDTVITISNKIMEGLGGNTIVGETQANIFVAHLIFSIINSSSKYTRSSVNPDGPELRKNIHGLSYFCFAQQAANQGKDKMTSLQLLKRALAPVSTDASSSSNSDIITFEGASISFEDGEDYTREDWDDMLAKIDEYRKFVAEDKLEDGSGNTLKGNTQALETKLEELFDDPLVQLPLAMRSCKNIVILMGMAEDSQSTHWEQTCLTTLIEALFPKARVHYYATYHRMKENTLTLIPSDYISGEIIDLINDYLSNVWEKEIDEDAASAMMLHTADPISADDIRAVVGENEKFEKFFPDFIKMRENTTGRFKLSEDYWNEKYISAAQVADMMNNVHEIVANVKREKKQRKTRSRRGI